jgi:hypothetical protein
MMALAVATLAWVPCHTLHLKLHVHIADLLMSLCILLVQTTKCIHP